jgi:uncharacterized protein (TIGR02246 family)
MRVPTGRFPLPSVRPTLHAALLAAGLAALPAGTARAQAQAMPASNVVTRGVALAPADRAALVRHRESFETAWARGDARALGALMSTRVVAGSGEGSLTVGREAMEKSYAALLAGPMRGATLHITVESQDAIRPDLTVSHGHYEVRRAGQAPMRARFMTMHERVGDEWLIRSMQTFTPTAAPPAR